MQTLCSTEAGSPHLGQIIVVMVLCETFRKKRQLDRSHYRIKWTFALIEHRLCSIVGLCYHYRSLTSIFFMEDFRVGSSSGSVLSGASRCDCCADNDPRQLRVT